MTPSRSSTIKIISPPPNHPRARLYSLRKNLRESPISRKSGVAKRQLCALECVPKSFRVEPGRRTGLDSWPTRSFRLHCAPYALRQSVDELLLSSLQERRPRARSTDGGADFGESGTPRRGSLPAFARTLGLIGAAAKPPEE